MCIGAALLLLVVHTAAALHQRHLAGDVDALIVVLRAVAGHHAYSSSPFLARSRKILAFSSVLMVPLS